jgi:hypothetical protein
MAVPVGSDKTPVWRNNVEDVLYDLLKLSQANKHIILSPDEAELILKEMVRLREDRCPYCEAKLCQFEVICRKCFNERQGSS